MIPKSMLGLKNLDPDRTDPEKAIKFYNNLKKNKLCIVPRKEDVKEAVELEQPHLHVITDSFHYKEPNDEKEKLPINTRNNIDVYIHC